MIILWKTTYQLTLSAFSSRGEGGGLPPVDHPGDYCRRPPAPHHLPHLLHLYPEEQGRLLPRSVRPLNHSHNQLIIKLSAICIYKLPNIYLTKILFSIELSNFPAKQTLTLGISRFHPYCKPHCSILIRCLLLFYSGQQRAPTWERPYR